MVLEHGGHGITVYSSMRLLEEDCTRGMVRVGIDVGPGMVCICVIWLVWVLMKFIISVGDFYMRSSL